MVNYKELCESNRVSIKRAIARFCYLKNINLSQEEFATLVRRTQDSGYRSAIKFLGKYFNNLSPNGRQQLLYQFTIEYNSEVIYCRQFPEANKVMKRYLEGTRRKEDIEFFRTTLYDIVKANLLQKEIIEKFI